MCHSEREESVSPAERVLRPANGLGPGPKLNARQQAERRSAALAKKRRGERAKWMKQGAEQAQQENQLTLETLRR